MANRSSDFNYKVALASGLKSLQGGRLRAAEEQFRYLVKNFPSAEGGYRGLAKVLVEQEDRAAALRMLLDGGAALAKADQRALAIQLYKEATTLEPNDLGAHRRLAAAYMLAGNPEDAAHEFVRFIVNAMSANDMQRAKLEAEFALERLPDDHEVQEAARNAGAEVKERPAATRRFDAPIERREPLIARAEPAMEPAAGPMPAAPPPSMWTPQEPARDTWNQPITKTNDAWAEVKMPGETGAPTSAPEADGESLGTVPEDADAQTVEATAAQFLASGDQRGGQAALEAARRYIAEGRIAAASDLLLQLIASGIARHDAQVLLVDVTKSMGKSEVTKTKVRLLIEALRLDGRDELAAEVEQLARAD